MIGLTLVLLSLRVLPAQDYEHDLSARYEVAQAIELVTDDAVERNLLIVTAAEESRFDREVLECRRKGDNGKAVGPWQTQVFGAKRRKACGSIVSAARIALAMMRASFTGCPGAPLRDGLATYASGRCDKGRRISRHRWALATRGER
jgi:hypothetical protein